MNENGKRVLEAYRQALQSQRDGRKMLKTVGVRTKTPVVVRSPACPECPPSGYSTTSSLVASLLRDVCDSPGNEDTLDVYDSPGHEDTLDGWIADFQDNLVWQASPSRGGLGEPVVVNTPQGDDCVRLDSVVQPTPPTSTCFCRFCKSPFPYLPSDLLASMLEAKQTHSPIAKKLDF